MGNGDENTLQSWFEEDDPWEDYELDEEIVVEEEEPEAEEKSPREYYPSSSSHNNSPLAYFFFLLSFIAVGAIFVFVVRELAPSVTEWWNEHFEEAPVSDDDGNYHFDGDREQLDQFCVDSGYAVRGDSLRETCDNYCQSEYPAPELMCPGCPVCPASWRENVAGLTREEVDEAINTYIDAAERIVAELRIIHGLHQALDEVMLSFGSNTSDLQRAMQSGSWVDLRNEIDDRTTNIGESLLRLWPPPPYDSSNPLLDAHGRLLMAWIQLDGARDILWETSIYAEPYKALTGNNGFLDAMETMIEYALLGLTHGRR